MQGTTSSSCAGKSCYSYSAEGKVFQSLFENVDTECLLSQIVVKVVANSGTGDGNMTYHDDFSDRTTNWAQ